MNGRGTIVYVHGAGDRTTDVDLQAGSIQEQLILAGMPFDVLPSRWGEAVGARLDRIDEALPRPPDERPTALAGELQIGATAHVSPGADRALDVDPLAELRKLGTGSRSAPRTARAEERPMLREADQLLTICRMRVGSPDEQVQSVDGSMVPLADACRSAAIAVERSSPYVRARASSVSERDLVAATGNAVAATAGGGPGALGGVVDRVRLRIAEAVLGAAAATMLAHYLGVDVGPGLKRWATDTLLPHRAQLTRDVVRGPADILLYLRNGAAIRRFVAETLAQALSAPGPVIAMGNSLGGIVLVELLAERDAPRPQLLVTPGSQAPLLETFGALHDANDERRPTPFQPWLNVYDPRDLLSFVAEPVWPDQPGIVDVALESGLGFPDSHGLTYLSNPRLYELLRGHPAVQISAAGGNSQSPASS